MTDPDNQRSPGTDGVPPPVLNTNRARQGIVVGPMRYVLAISVALVVIGFVVAYLAT